MRIVCQINITECYVGMDVVIVNDYVYGHVVVVVVVAAVTVVLHLDDALRLRQ